MLVYNVYIYTLQYHKSPHIYNFTHFFEYLEKYLTKFSGFPMKIITRAIRGTNNNLKKTHLGSHCKIKSEKGSVPEVHDYVDIVQRFCSFVLNNTYICGDITISYKNSRKFSCLLLITWRFSTKFTASYRKFEKKNSRNNILQLKYKYITYLMKNKHLY